MKAFYVAGCVLLFLHAGCIGVVWFVTRLARGAVVFTLCAGGGFSVVKCCEFCLFIFTLLFYIFVSYSGSPLTGGKSGADALGRARRSVSLSLGRSLCGSFSSGVAEASLSRRSSCPACFNKDCASSGSDLIVFIGSVGGGKVSSVYGEVKGRPGLFFGSYACSLGRLGRLGRGLSGCCFGGPALQGRVG